jgi:HlyD family secretion protein
MNKPDIFRKVALDRLASPEQLDQLMQVTTPKGWLGLGTLGALLIAAVIWSIIGTIPERIPGQAILLRSGGVFEVVSQSGGRVVDLPFQVGDMISEGQTVARLDQPTLSEQIRQAKLRVTALDAQYARNAQLLGRSAQLQNAATAQRRADLLETMRADDVVVANLRDRVRNEERLVDRGLLTNTHLLNTRQELEQARAKVRASANQITDLGVQALQSLTQAEHEQQAAVTQLLQARQELARLESDHALQSTIKSAYGGRVLEVMVEQGGIVNPGAPILTVSLTGKAVADLEAVAYVPSIHGKKIRAGMDIQIAPSTVKPEEYGYLVGRVTYVSDFPATPQGMQRVLKNQMLVQALSGSDAPYEVHADLLPDPDPASVSQYRWTSSQGPPTRIQSGTLATAAIVVNRRRPIYMVIPQLRARSERQERPPVETVGMRTGGRR